MICVFVKEVCQEFAKPAQADLAAGIQHSKTRKGTARPAKSEFVRFCMSRGRETIMGDDNGGPRPDNVRRIWICETCAGISRGQETMAGDHRGRPQTDKIRRIGICEICAGIFDGRHNLENTIN